MTSKEKVKEVLYEDLDKLVYILEELGCHKINPHFSKDQVRCALPDGTTGTSVSVIINPCLNVSVFSRGEYDDYEIKDIITLVQFIKHLTFRDALSWLCQKLNIDFDGGICSVSDTLEIVNDLRKEKRKKSKALEPVIHTYLPESELRKYRDYIVAGWINEGISAETQKKYGIKISDIEQRWMIPIRDENGRLLSLKGRTFAPNWKEFSIPKFKYYPGIGTNDIIFGLNHNMKSIKAHDEIILFEAEKSVMASDSYKVDWAGGIGKNGINPYIRKKILSMHLSKCVIGFDHDVDYKSICSEARKLTSYMDVYIMDTRKLLVEKQSPTDAGEEIYHELYNNKIKFR